ncbi:MAG TPA: periplasmic heavy metal sensor [Thermoanaerobaculia bacterium]|nr:periplasmic heavy metal sensor [Thermoanaerobaculia bacterium]
MSSKRKMLTAAALIGLFAMPVLAQQEIIDVDHHAAVAYLVAHPNILVRTLHLTAAEVTTLNTLVTTARNTVKPLRTADQSLTQQIQALLKDPNPDPCAIGALVISRHDNYELIEAAFQQFDTDFSAILTPDQLTRYEALKAVLRNTPD